MTQRLRRSPAFPRVAPFLVFLLLTWLQGQFGETSRYWFYLAKTVVGGWLVWSLRPEIQEMRWRWSLPALLAGVAVFVLWVGLDPWYPSLDRLEQTVVNPLLVKLDLSPWAPDPARMNWNPHTVFGTNSAAAWFFILVRLLGSALVVPPLEEVFYRSFLYRYLIRTDFLATPLGRFVWWPFLATSLIFGLTHFQWLAGVLCGLIYQGLVCWKKRLDDAVAAHCVTNLLLGLWVLWRGAWHFW